MAEPPPPPAITGKAIQVRTVANPWQPASRTAEASKCDKPTTAGNAARIPYCSAPGRVCFLFVSFLCRTPTQRKVTGSPRRGMSYGRWVQQPTPPKKTRHHEQSNNSNVQAHQHMQAPALSPNPSPASGRGEQTGAVANPIAPAAALRVRSRMSPSARLHPHHTPKNTPACL